MRNTVISGLIAAWLMGCAANTPPPSPTPTIIIPVEEKRTDLPFNWFEVKGNGWSYGLPMGFDSSKPDYPYLATHYSMFMKVGVNFTAHSLDQPDLFKFIGTYLEPRKNQLRDIRENALGIIAVYLVSPVIVNNMREASLEFFVRKDKSVYHMSCVGDATQIKKYASTCFDIIDTLRLK